MQVMKERPDENALTIDKSASALGLHEFSLLSRIQAGEIKSARSRSGEMLIPREVVERLVGCGSAKLRMRLWSTGVTRIVGKVRTRRQIADNRAKAPIRLNSRT